MSGKIEIKKEKELLIANASLAVQRHLLIQAKPLADVTNFIVNQRQKRARV
jgi:hypothetical protein